MKRMVSIMVWSAALMCGAASVETATFEDIASDAQVVTAVDLSGLASEAAVADAADAGTNYVDAATNAVMTGVDGKGYLTSESDPAWRAWTNGTRVALGKSAVASGRFSTALGDSSKASGGFSTALGYSSKASGGNSTALGDSSKASGGRATAVGDSSKASGLYSTALGRVARAYSLNSVAIGYGAVASNTYAVAIGDGTPSEPYTYEYETIINEDGEEEVITNSSATVIGFAFAAGIHSTALGYMAYAPANSLGLAYTPDTILLCSSNTTSGAGSTARSLRSYIRYTRKTLDAASFTAEDGVIYSLTLDDTMAASGIDVTLPESKDWVQDFILRLENPTTSATQFGDLSAAAIDYPNGKLTETGAIEAGTTNYFTFTETGAGRWMITSLPANK